MATSSKIILPCNSSHLINMEPAINLSSYSEPDKLHETSKTSELVQNSVPPNYIIELIMNGFVAMIIIGLGLVGNMLTVIVLTRRTMRSSTNNYLTALAIWDSFVLVGTLFLMTLPLMSEDFRIYVHPYIVVYVYPFCLIAQTATLWLTVSFTVERYIAVCHPLKAAQICTIKRARQVIVIVSICSIFFNVIRWFDYKLVYSISNNNTDVVMVTYQQTDFGASDAYRIAYFLCLYLVIMFFIPWISLFLINMFLCRAVKLSQKQRRNMNVRQDRENNVTIMLVSVVVVFIICQLPALVYNVAWAIDMNKIRTNYAWNTLSSVRNFMVTLNSAVNFILYCAIGQKFRRTFWKTFCARCARSSNYNSMAYPHSTMGTSIANDRYRIIHAKTNDHFEMTDTCNCLVTNSTSVTKYSPVSLSEKRQILTRPQMIYENGTKSNSVATVNNAKRNGDLLKEVYGSDIEDDVDDVTSCTLSKTQVPGVPSMV